MMNYNPAATAYANTLKKLKAQEQNKPEPKASNGLLARSMPSAVKQANKIENEADDRVLEIVKQIREQRKKFRNG